MVIHGAGGNFCSGGDVHEIIGPLLEMGGTDLLNFTRMTGGLVKAMRACPLPVIAAVDGICAGAGAAIAMAADLRVGTARSRTAFPLHPGGIGWLRHGGLRPAAAHHRAGPGNRIVAHGAFDGRRGSAGKPVFSTVSRNRNGFWTNALNGPGNLHPVRTSRTP